MLFNSYVFLLAFLPTVLAIYHGLRLRGLARASKIWLVAASLFFYGWWDYRYVLLIAASILINYTLGVGLETVRSRSKSLLILGLAFNLSLLGWYKYAAFFASALHDVVGAELVFRKIALPLAISFFTFQQISYLVESYKDRKSSRSLLDYCLFVLFFPHLIAGPITHHREMLPQFAEMGRKRLPSDMVRIGCALLVLGLGKKVLIADALGDIANPIFRGVALGHALSFSDAWLGALAYTFQLYFDFSGYSDMAIGLALLFGIRMPVNFASPYKATNIIEFWRRWHISLSRFLRNYVYIPLGGNRQGAVRRHVNLMATMALGGLWHGAGWTFVAWGVAHGAFLIVNHVWRSALGRRPAPALAPHHNARSPSQRLTRSFPGALSWAVTFVAVTAAWVLFRAETFHSAVRMLAAMASWPEPPSVRFGGSAMVNAVGVAAAGAVALLAPNSLELAGYPHHVADADYERAEAPIRDRRWSGGPVLATVLLGAVVALVLAKLPDPGVFLYFTF